MTYPTGYTAVQAATLVQNKTNEPTAVPYSTVVGFLNDGLDEVTTAVGPILANATIAVTANQITVALPEDVQDVQALFYSATTPLQAGWTPYEVMQYGPKEFMLYTGGIPTVGGGPPFCYTIINDQSGVLTIELGSPMAGYLFVVYHQRPQLWLTGSDTTSQASTTTLDPSFQRAAVLYACTQVCEALENYRKAGYFQGLYDAKIEQLRSEARRRRQRKPSMVRDVTSGAQSWPFPYFWKRP